MVGRKLALLQNGIVFPKEETVLETPYWEKVKNATARNAKKYAYVGLVEMIRFHVRFSDFLKNKFTELKNKIKNMRRAQPEEKETKEPSRFLQTISEYKGKIRAIKHRIKEEENL
jgi:hypothetical protein